VRAVGLPETTLAERLTATPAEAQALHRVLLRPLATGAGLAPLAEATAAAWLTADRARTALNALSPPSWSR
jgi:hypothetical protein